MDEPKSMKKCCEKTLHNIEKKQKQQNVNRLKSAFCQTELINEIKFKSNRKGSSRSTVTYTTDQQLKPFGCKSSISYDIIFKPTSERSKEINSVCLKIKV